MNVIRWVFVQLFIAILAIYFALLPDTASGGSCRQISIEEQPEEQPVGEPVISRLMREYPVANYDRAKLIKSQIALLNQTKNDFKERINAARAYKNQQLEEELLKERWKFVDATFEEQYGDREYALEALAKFYEDRQRYESAYANRAKLVSLALRHRNGHDIASARLKLAKLLENQQCWEDAVPHIRLALNDMEPYDKFDVSLRLQALQQLANNLSKQGKVSQVLDIQKQAYEVSEVKAKRADELKAELVAQIKTKPLNKGHFDTLRQELDTKEPSKFSRNYRDGIDFSEGEEKFSMLYNNWQGRHESSFDTPAKERVKLAKLQYAAGRFAEAEEGLNRVCSSLLDKLLLDTGSLAQPINPIESVSPFQCYTELALARARLSMHSRKSIDGTVFTAAQYSTQTDAGIAILQSAARAFASQSGAEPILDQIDNHRRVEEDNFRPFLSKWSYDNPSKQKTILANSDYASDYARDLMMVLNSNRQHEMAMLQLVSDLRTKVPRYFELRQFVPVTLENLQTDTGSSKALLSDDEAVILWMTVPDKRHGLVFAISKKAAAWSDMTLDGDEIFARVDKLRHQIDPCAYGSRQEDCDERGKSFDRQAAWELYQALLGQSEIQAVIGVDSIKTLMIVPSGPLIALPPAVLITEPPNYPSGETDYDSTPQAWSTAHWLIKKKALSILPSISALRALRATIPAKSRLILANQRPGELFMFADPDFSGKGDTTLRCMYDAHYVSKDMNGFRDAKADRASLPRLPCTRVEGEILHKMLGGVLLTGREAREARLRMPEDKVSLANAKFVAFATHSLIPNDFWLGEPALALAAPLEAEKNDNGFLTASKIVGLKLSAELVLLSACNTAGPDANNVEGMSGLSRAFFFAGARSILASHWRIDDNATTDLVTNTIERYQKGTPKAQALREASLAVLRKEIGSKDDIAAHPATWAPFVLIGEPR